MECHEHLIDGAFGEAYISSGVSSGHDDDQQDSSTRAHVAVLAEGVTVCRASIVPLHEDEEGARHEAASHVWPTLDHSLEAR